MSNSYTRPVKPAVKAEIKAAHMENHARCIEELQRKLLPKGKRGKGKPKPAASPPCPFGEIITFEGDRYIRGGVVYGGDDNWNVADYLINLAADSDNLIWLEVGITANTEDSVLMPHLESCDEPTWESGAVAGGYPSNTAPNITTGVGTRIVPIGQLTVVDGAATLDPVGCGNITLGFCPPNNLSITRT